MGAAGSWIVGLENVSSIQPWLSDCFCRASTGDALVRRKLYSDSELAVLTYRRAIILNGVDLGALRGDLGDRYGNAPEAIKVWFRKAAKQLASGHRKKASRSLGILAHLLGDLANPKQTDQTNREASTRPMRRPWTPVAAGESGSSSATTAAATPASPGHKAKQRRKCVSPATTRASFGPTTATATDSTQSLKCPGRASRGSRHRKSLDPMVAPP